MFRISTTMLASCLLFIATPVWGQNSQSLPFEVRNDVGHTTICFQSQGNTKLSCRDRIRAFLWSGKTYVVEEQDDNNNYIYRVLQYNVQVKVPGRRQTTCGIVKPNELMFCNALLVPLPRFNYQDQQWKLKTSRNGFLEYRPVKEDDGSSAKGVTPPPTPPVQQPPTAALFHH